MGFHYTVMITGCWVSITAELFCLSYFAQNLKSWFQPKIWIFLSNYMCRAQLYAVETQIFVIFLSKLSIKNRFFFSNMPCFSKMVSTNGNGFPFKDDGFPLQGFSINGKLVYISISMYSAII